MQVNQKHRDLVGTQMAGLDDQRWRLHRQVVGNAFQLPVLKNCVEVFFDLTTVLYNQIDSQEIVEIAPLLRAFALDSVAKALFNWDFGATNKKGSKYQKAYEQIFDLIGHPIYRPFLKYSWFPAAKQFNYSIDVVIEMLNMIISTKASGNQEISRYNTVDVMQKLYEPDNGLTDQEKRSDVFFLIAAGHETTVTAMAYSLYYMAKYPEMQTRVQEEIRSVLGNEEPTMDSLKKLSYLTCVIKEALRMNTPAANIVLRQTAEDVIMEGVTIPKGTNIGLALGALHKWEEYWPEPVSQCGVGKWRCWKGKSFLWNDFPFQHLNFPFFSNASQEKFDPERFTPENSQGRNPWSYAPFGIGMRSCIGENFAMLEAQTLLATFLRKYRIELAADIQRKRNFMFDQVISLKLKLTPNKS